jgi:hypothetical protein
MSTLFVRNLITFRTIIRYRDTRPYPGRRTEIYSLLVVKQGTCLPTNIYDIPNCNLAAG